MPGNADGSYSVDASDDMWAFDRLPPDVRKFLTECCFNFAAPTVAGYIERFGRSATVERVKQVERKTLLESRLETWGPDYPATQ